MADTGFPHKLLYLIEPGPHMRAYIAQYCDPGAFDADKWRRLSEFYDRVEAEISYLKRVGLYDLSPQDFSTGATPHD